MLMDDQSEILRLQAEEHPLIEDEPAQTAPAHCQRLIHLKAYEEAAQYAAGLDVLDVGCNTGYGTMHLVSAARRVVGVDVSPRAIELARQRATDGSPEFLHTDGGALPFGDATFDLVTSFQVLEHVPEPLEYLREIRRVLRPGGTVILTTPNATVRLYPGMQPWNRFHVREYLPAELRVLLEGEFADARVRGMFGIPTLYEVVISGYDAARKRVAAREAKEQVQAARVSAAGRPRPLPRRLARAVVPAALRARLRSLISRPAPRPLPVAPLAPPEVAPDLEAVAGFSTADLFYSDQDLDRALDLIAICRANPG